MKADMIAAAALLSILTLGCQDRVFLPASYSVRYVVAGTAREVLLTYKNPQEGVEQITGAPLPWSRAGTYRAGILVYVGAQSMSDSGAVTCEIWVDGEKWRTSTSVGAFVSVTCSGVLGRE